MKESKSRFREALCFAGVFLVAHILVGVLFDQNASIDAPEGASRWSPILDQLFRSVVTVAVATPIFLVLMSLYRKRKASMGRKSDRERT